MWAKKRRNLYIDQIMQYGNKNNTPVLVDLLEAAMVKIITELPHIKTSSLQSDNTWCYKGVIIFLIVHFLTQSITRNFLFRI